MAIVVQKFGGTSVADAHRIHLAARRAVRAKLAGRRVVLVVSAMGHTTDRLIELAYQVSRRPARREMDMLISTGEQVSIALMAMAIHEAGHEAISLTGAQVGLLTDSDHTAARIRSINTDRIHTLLAQGRIVIVAGFQGVDPEFNITTLGRGGSDTTAVALAAALGAETCEIFTDVDGVYTCDPRIVPQARKLDVISYDEMLELASLGAGVMHGRAVEVGMKYGVPIHVRSSFTDSSGTVIMQQTPGMEDIVVRGVSLKRDIGRVTLTNLPSRAGVIAQLFERVAERRIVVDDIIQNVYDEGRAAALSFTMPATDLGECQAIAELFLKQADSDPTRTPRLEVEDALCKVSIVGVGMRSHHGAAARLFDSLSRAGVPIENVSTSEIVVSVLVRREFAEKAVAAAHEAFALEQPANEAGTGPG